MDKKTVVKVAGIGLGLAALIFIPKIVSAATGSGAIKRTYSVS